MFVLGVENFFYNLFAEYVKDCESRRDADQRLRSMRAFTQEKAGEIGPSHPSFIFAMIMALVGNLGLTAYLFKGERIWQYVLGALIGLLFIAIMFGWRRVVYPQVVRRLQRIFDASDGERSRSHRRAQRQE